MAGSSYREKGRKYLAWASFGLALVAGTAIAATFLGGWISGLLGIFPWWIAAAAVLANVVLIGRDLFMDGEPNFIALYMAMGLPSLALAAGGKFSAAVGNLADKILTQANKVVGEWFGVHGAVPAIAVAAVCVLVSLLLGQRMVTRSAGGRR